MRVTIVDDNRQFRESLEIYLSMRLGYQVIGNYENAKTFLKSTEVYKSDIVLMDIEMPDINGIEATKQAIWMNKDLHVIAVTNYQDRAYLTTLITAGFKGCVFKNNVFEELNSAINKVNNGEQFFPKNIRLLDTNN
ncbi:MAG TPA: hypothetical protein DDX98_13720 [Bacteroidales bacterium]|jgi:DNA-binding NarL/FixJ family response regulator|nr:hypothetical protein [Bacteroidales bacterium]